MELDVNFNRVDLQRLSLDSLKRIADHVHRSSRYSQRQYQIVRFKLEVREIDDSEFETMSTYNIRKLRLEFNRLQQRVTDLEKLNEVD